MSCLWKSRKVLKLLFIIINIKTFFKSCSNTWIINYLVIPLLYYHLLNWPDCLTYKQTACSWWFSEVTKRVLPGLHVLFHFTKNRREFAQQVQALKWCTEDKTGLEVDYTVNVYDGMSVFLSSSCMWVFSSSLQQSKNHQADKSLELAIGVSRAEQFSKIIKFGVLFSILQLPFVVWLFSGSWSYVVSMSIGIMKGIINT